MNMHFTGKGFVNIITFILYFVFSFNLHAQARDVEITIHVRGIYDSKISLLALSGSKTFKPIASLQGIKNGATVKLSVSKEFLPGEFVLRFDYMDTETSTPYPSEKSIIINQQDFELCVNPKSCNIPDSSWFQKDERENTAYARFSKESTREKEQLGLLQNFLMKYDETGSTFYLQGIREYDQRRKTYNQWLKNRTEQDKSLFVSSLYGFQYLPDLSFTGSETERINSLINHYFDGMDFNDPLILKTSAINKWMDAYVNLYGQLSFTGALRDSLLPVAGKTAIDKARQGNPVVYGWMVDYFYYGYETNGISAGMKILEPYLNDPGCLTSKRQEISKRLKGMETLVPGSSAPDISMRDQDGKSFELKKLQTPCKYVLVLFWSAGCIHCMETVNKLYPWQQQAKIWQKIMVVAISLDETESETKAWEQKINELKGWKHLRAAEGVRSKVAGDYFVLATPVMVLIDSKTRKIVSVPNTLEELMTAIK